MPPTYTPYADKRAALDQIAKAINEIKAAFAGTDRESKIEDMLPELRELWRAAYNGDDAPALIKLVYRLNAKKHLTHKQFGLTRSYTEAGWTFDVEVKNYN